MTERQNEQIQNQVAEDTMIQLQGSLVNKLIKRVFPDKIVTSDFKKEFSKVLSIFIFYVQSGQSKKKYGQKDILQFLEKKYLGKVADSLRNKSKTRTEQKVSRKKQIDQMQIEAHQNQNEGVIQPLVQKVLQKGTD